MAEEVAAFDKTTHRTEDLGLSIADSKALLAVLQHRIVEALAKMWSDDRRCCETCGLQDVWATPAPQGRLSDRVSHAVRRYPATPPGLYRCRCQENSGPATVSPLTELIAGLIAERTMAGLAAARARGRMDGRPRKMDRARLVMAMSAMADRKAVAAEVAKRLNLTTTTLYTYVNGDGTPKAAGHALLDGTYRSTPGGRTRSWRPSTSRRSNATAGA